MKAIAINGSPRQGGNTEILLKEVLNTLEVEGWSTQYRQIGGKPVRGCIACMKCVEKRNGRCVIDDQINEYIEQMLEVDAIILGSPTYFAGIAPELKALVDRAGFVALANNNAFSGKIGAAVVAVRRGGATHVFDTINHMFLISSMIVPGSAVYWNMGVGGDKGDVRNDEEGMQNMAHLGQVIAWLGKAMASVPKESPFPVRTVELH